MKKAVVFAIIAIIIGVIFLSISTISPNEDLKENEVIEEEKEAVPQGRNLSVELDEKMGFATP